ncbi:MAG TPA: rhodanese-like domain-containing protein [Bacteroidia bacterium]|nr:rhodanese-like domain-containing protein [Bacteroidia bacterium]
MLQLKLIAAFVILFLSGHSQNSIQNADPATFKTLIESKKYILIDLRTDDEIKSKGMIKGAMHLDYLAKDSEKTIQKLDRGKSYLVYCAGGGRSSECAELMKSLGFKEVVNLTKGFDDWKRKGFETVSR